MLIIKDAGVADIPIIRNITFAVWPATYIPIIGQQQVAYMLHLFYDPVALENQMTEKQHRFTICYNDELPVGFASWSATGPHIFKLHKLYVLPSGQGKGAGRAMIAHIIADIKKLGAKELHLNVNIHNHPAISFYRKAGFQHLYDEDIDIGNGYFMNDHVLGLAIV